ncbi:GLPGLI family protein [Longitalea luteola]|uniref:GLPGLI family protein n=1 Tax=Longitalea luteola TaxID=2812563 RepID=UPI001A9704B4|nr:GLPGLI family protein [Longitalea luteola]
MKAIYFLASVFLILKAQAQQQSGRVVYEFTRQIQLRVAGGSGGMEQSPPPPRAHVIKLEVLFGNDQMLRQSLVDNTMNDFAGNENGASFRSFGMGDDDITWINFAEGRKVEQREFAARLYLITDSIRKQHWKLTGESRNILGYTCQQATTTRVSKRSTISMENGVMTKKDIPDTSRVTVWFTTAIPVPAGPDYQGQLPGLILQIDINNNTTYKALEISQKTDLAAIKEPKKGKKLSAEQFKKEWEKEMEGMQRNAGGRRVMHIGN